MSSPDAPPGKSGACLCGAIQWTYSGELRLPHACHCSICRKLHGTAYGAYAIGASENLGWRSGREEVARYRSSETGERCFCPRCGSVVPDPLGVGPETGIPLGPISEASSDIGIGGHIFVSSQVPWFERTDRKPAFETWPPGIDLPSYATPERRAETPTRIGGSCLCGDVRFEVTELFFMRNCHCLRCRRARCAPHATNALSRQAGFAFVAGGDRLASWKVPEAKFFTQTFCVRCSAPMPFVDPSRDLVVIPAGSFDDDPGRRPSEHIFVGSKAAWFEITDALPQHLEAAP